MRVKIEKNVALNIVKKYAQLYGGRVTASSIRDLIKNQLKITNVKEMKVWQSRIRSWLCLTYKTEFDSMISGKINKVHIKPAYVQRYRYVNELKEAFYQYLCNRYPGEKCTLRLVEYVLSLLDAHTKSDFLTPSQINEIKNANPLTVYGWYSNRRCTSSYRKNRYLGDYVSINKSVNNAKNKLEESSNEKIKYLSEIQEVLKDPSIKKVIVKSYKDDTCSIYHYEK